MFMPALRPFRNAVLVDVVAAYANSLSNPPTSATYTVHNAQLDRLAGAATGILMVAHSQGNLFANEAYKYISPKVGAGRVSVVHIAPASPTLSGPHVLAHIDKVINLLRVHGWASVPPNTPIPNSSVDWSGHEMLATYLDPTRDGRGMVKNLLAAAHVNLTATARSIGRRR